MTKSGGTPRYVSVRPSIGFFWFDSTEKTESASKQNQRQFENALWLIGNFASFAMRFNDLPAAIDRRGVPVNRGSVVVIFNSAAPEAISQIEQKVSGSGAFAEKLGMEAGKRRCSFGGEESRDDPGLYERYFIFWSPELKGYEIGGCILGGLLSAFGVWVDPEKTEQVSGNELAARAAAIRVLLNCSYADGKIETACVENELRE